MSKLELLYQFSGILCVFAQFLVSFVAFMLSRPKEGFIAVLFGISNAIIYLWR